MNRLSILLMSLILAFSAAWAQKVYRWVDKDGNVHFGDRVPPEYAEQVFGRPDTGKTETPEDLAAAQQAKEDRVLLMTYLSVEEIEAVRDRRIDQLQSRAAVTQRYLDSLRERLERLRREEKWYGRVNPDTGEQGEVPADVLAEIETTLESIAEYEGRMTRSAEEQQSIEAKFAKDIVRFRELKGLPAGTDAVDGDEETESPGLTTATASSGGD